MIAQFPIRFRHLLERRNSKVNRIHYGCADCLVRICKAYFHPGFLPKAQAIADMFAGHEFTTEDLGNSMFDSGAGIIEEAIALGVLIDTGKRVPSKYGKHRRLRRVYCKVDDSDVIQRLEITT